MILGTMTKAPNTRQIFSRSGQAALVAPQKWHKRNQLGTRFCQTNTRRKQNIENKTKQNIEKLPDIRHERAETPCQKAPAESLSEIFSKVS